MTTTTATLTGTSTTITTTSTTAGFPSLFCFAVMRAYTNEHQLIKEQLKHGLGIFDCDTYLVISNQVVMLGKNYTGGDVYTWLNPAPPLHFGNLAAGQTTNSWLNTQVFINAFD